MKAEYRTLLTEAYDLDKPEPPEDELAYYRQFAELSPGPVLEAMCGSGRFLVPLRREDVDIDGFDSSTDMLDACKRRCADEGLTARLWEQDAQRLETDRRYGLVFCGGGSFGLIADEADAADALRRFHDHMLPGATLLLEVEQPKPSTRGGLWGGRFWRRADGAIITLRGNLRPVSEELEEGVGIYELWVDGRLQATELNAWVRRYWTPDGISAALHATGFTDIRVTAAFSNEPVSETTSMVSVVARRP